MSNLIESMAEKVSAYQIFNFLLPGAVFVAAFGHVSGHALVSGNVVVDLIVVYFTGMTLSRVGSLMIEPICKWTRIVTYANYEDYLEAVKRDAIIPTLLQENNTYRTLAATFLALLFVKIALYFQSRLTSTNLHLNWLWLIALFVLFLLSYRKQTAYIRKRVNRAKS